MIKSQSRSNIHTLIIGLCFMNVINVTLKKEGFGSSVEALLNQLKSANENARFTEIDQSETSILVQVF